MYYHADASLYGVGLSGRFHFSRRFEGVVALEYEQAKRVAQIYMWDYYASSQNYSLGLDRAESLDYERNFSVDANLINLSLGINCYYFIYNKGFRLFSGLFVAGSSIGGDFKDEAIETTLYWLVPQVGFSWLLSLHNSIDVTVQYRLDFSDNEFTTIAAQLGFTRRF